MLLPKETGGLAARTLVTRVRGVEGMGSKKERRCRMESPHHDDIARPGLLKCPDV